MTPEVRLEALQSASEGQVNSPVPLNERFINRDLSLIEFFRRVLEEGLDASQPPLERLKFLSIVSSNLDEFFMIRVSALKEKESARIEDPDSMSTTDLLRQVRERVLEITNEQVRCLVDDVLPDLKRRQIDVAKYSELSDAERRFVDAYFSDQIYPLLTPQAVDPTHPFPYISGLSLNLGLIVRPTLTRRVEKALKNVGNEFFVRVKIPDSVPRTLRIGSSDRFILSEDLIKANIRRLVPEADPAGCFAFRLSRDADIDLREEETEDLLQAMEENLKARRFGSVVRLEVCESMPAEMLAYLKESLDIEEDDVYRVNGPLDLGGLMELYKIDRQDLKDQKITPYIPSALQTGESTFDVIKKGDILLHHPYMPYSIVTDFIREAANDPDVMAIKMCLYRIGAESPIAPLLIEASEKGKQVTALIEIKARFDEANNIEWAKRLEEAGVHVVYGMMGLKTHCKTTLVVRCEEGKLVRYAHIATGNYNPETSAFYTDLGLLTCDREIGEDATELFNYLTVYSQRQQFKKLIIAPINLRQRMVELIEREAEHARSGRNARIIAKMNRLADAEITNALYAASQAGVQIDLIIRGISVLRPGVPGLSDNIRVRSIVGPLLEHSRAYYFENGGADEVYVGSSDWMPRNLDRRIEVLAPVEDPQIRRYLKEDFLGTYLADNTKARELGPDGYYRRVEPVAGERSLNSQLSFQHNCTVVPFEAHN